jgi:protein KIBRA
VLASDLSDHQSPPPLAAAAAATASGSSATFVPPNLSNLKDCPLPEGWDIGMDYDGKPYFIDHKNKTTSWVDPRDSLTKPADFTECVGDELPVGWEQAYDYHRGGIYYVDHRNQRTQETDPRSEWRALQEEMLRSYLASAKNDLKAKQELIDVKHQRLSLAQDEYHNLNNTLSNLSASSTSLNSTCSTGSKYDVDLLRADVGQCKARVQKLKRELVNMDAEVCIKQKGMETLARVKDKYSEENNGLTLEEARAIKAELNNIQKSLTVGEQEKIDLMKNLACLKDDLTRLQHSDSTLDVSKQSQMMERLSTASQTDLSGELMPVGQRLAEMARIRLQYDETRQQVQDIQQSLASLEEKN